MSKAKWSFSLIMAVFIVGILSTGVLAATDPYNLKAVQNGLGLDVSFNGNSSDTSDMEGTNFDLLLKHGSSTVKTYGPVALDSSNKGIFHIQGDDLAADTQYSVELYHSSNLSEKLSSISVSVTAADNKEMYQVPDTHVDVNGSGLKNANLTGLNNVNKARDGQSVHGSYQNNTNSCASCHQTHTGQDDSLLFKDGVYSTCSACHDGTTGAYNSFAPIDEKTPDSIAGTFNVLTAGHNGSMHEADGSIKVSSAPGGNKSPANGTPFSQDFDCASCHAPHGAGSNNENNLNIDPLGWGKIKYNPSTPDGKNGKLFQNIKIYTSVPNTQSDPYILVKTTTNSDQSKVDANYFYKRAHVTANTPIIQTYRWSYDDQTQTNAYVPDYSLWLREKGYPYKADTALYNDTWDNLSLTNANHYNDTSKDITLNSDVNVVWRDGFAWGTGIANVKSAQVSLGIDVETSDNIRSLYDSNYVVKDSNGKIDPAKSYIPESGVEMNKYCTACHTDYLSASEKNESGTYTEMHRHQTVSDSLTCVRCHFAHGSEAEIMHDANDNTYFDLIKPKSDGGKFGMSSDAAIAYLKDPNPSSALKRYTGMSSCYVCHGGDEQNGSNPNTTQ